MQTTVSGRGPDLVLLHGWGMRAKVWSALAPVLGTNFRVHSVELPVASGPDGLDALVDAVSAASSPQVIACGWSMGGQLALRWAMREPAQVARLVLIATTPRFVRAFGWEHGMDSAVFDAFAGNLKRNAGATLQRFVQLQAHGDASARVVARRLQACTAAAGEAGEDAALIGGLELLKTTDLRMALPEVVQPALILHGARDAVVPVGAGEYLHRNLPHAQLAVIDGAAHAPFIAQPELVARRIAEFCHG